MQENSKTVNIGGIIIDLLYFVLGLLLLVLDSNTILSITFTILGIFIIVINVLPLIYFIGLCQHDKRYFTLVVYEILLIVAGVLVITSWDNPIIAIIVGICLISYPIVNSLRKKDSWAKAIINNIPYIMLGILLFFIPASTILGIVIKVIGVLVMVYSAFLIILKLIIMIKISKHNDDNNHIDSDSNNHDESTIIDAEYKDLN